MSTLLSQPAVITPDDLLRMPDAVGYELVGGKLVERHVSMESSRVASRICRILGTEAERTGECVIYPPDLGYQCFPEDPGEARKPDVSAIRKDRLAAIGSQDCGYCPIPADLAVEVVSPNDLYNEVFDKVKEYLSAGFGVVWVVVPQHKMVTVYRWDESIALVRANQAISAEPAFASLRLPVADFFAE
jgi:Uma2 family endonuclease